MGGLENILLLLMTVLELHLDELLAEGFPMRMDAVNENVRELINFIGLQVDFISSLLTITSFLILQLLPQVEDFIITSFDECVKVGLKIL